MTGGPLVVLKFDSKFKNEEQWQKNFGDLLCVWKAYFFQDI